MIRGGGHEYDNRRLLESLEKQLFNFPNSLSTQRRVAISYAFQGRFVPSFRPVNRLSKIKTVSLFFLMGYAVLLPKTLEAVLVYVFKPDYVDSILDLVFYFSVYQVGLSA